MARPRSSNDIGIAAAHDRVRTDRGSPAQYLCSAPECSAQATDWAYRHDSPWERVQLVGDKQGHRYSPDPQDYDPMCRSCHGAKDRLEKRGNRCINGHPRSGDSLKIRKDGRTECRLCHNARERDR